VYPEGSLTFLNEVRLARERRMELQLLQVPSNWRASVRCKGICMLVAVYVQRRTEPGSCTSMFSVAMSNTSYPKVSNNTFFPYHCVRTRSGAHNAPYLAGDEDLNSPSR
jgi:hypothetical protein